MSSDQEGQRLTHSDREMILSRIHSPLYWVGKFIPDEETIEGKKVPVRDLVFDYISKEHRTQEEIMDASAFAHKLEQRVHEIEHTIKEADITREEAESLLDEMLGLMRAVDELRQRGDAAELRLQTMLSKVEEEKRWMNFVRKIL